MLCSVLSPLLRSSVFNRSLRHLRELKRCYAEVKIAVLRQLPSQFELNPDLDDPIRRETEKIRRAAGVACEKDEQMLAPSRHAEAIGRKQREVREIIRHVVTASGHRLKICRRQ